MTTLTFALAGAVFRPAEAKAITRLLKPGDRLTFEDDPHNQYDSTAVKVLSAGTFIGFIPAAQNAEISVAIRLNGASPEGIVLANDPKLRHVIEVTF